MTKYNTYRLLTKLLLLTSIIILPINVGAGDNRYKRYQIYPAKNQTSDPLLNQTIQKLKQIALSKNIEKLQPLLNKDEFWVHHDMPENIDPIDYFLKYWKLNDHPEKSQFWLELELAIRFGCNSYAKNKVVCPYYEYYYTEDSRLASILEKPDYGIILGEKVNVRKKPSIKSKVIAQLTYDVVLAPQLGEEAVTEKIGDSSYPWISIILYNGKTGYVYGKYFKRVMSERLYLEKIEGKWLLTGFSGGC